MSDTQEESSERNLPFDEWMKTSAEFWEPMSKMWSGFAEGVDGSPPVSGKWDKGGIDDLLGNSSKSWESLASSMAETDVAEALFRTGLFKPDEMSKMVQDGWNNCIKQQQQWAKNEKDKDETFDKDRFEELNQKTFDRWMETYEKEFRKFLNIPKLGITRIYQEKLSQAFDKLNLFNVNMAEFLYFLYVPIKQAFKDMQEELTELSKTGSLPDDCKEYYNRWLRKLEGYYFTLFQSTQYTKVLGKTLSTMGEFLSKRDEIFQDVLKMFPIPTQKEIDGMYKDIYELKKRLNKLEKKVEG